MFVYGVNTNSCTSHDFIENIQSLLLMKKVNEQHLFDEDIAETVCCVIKDDLNLNHQALM